MILIVEIKIQNNISLLYRFNEIIIKVPQRF